MCHQKKKSGTSPLLWLFLGMMAAVAVFVAGMCMRCKCKKAERAVEACMCRAGTEGQEPDGD